jgi:hypothetical protein
MPDRIFLPPLWGKVDGDAKRRQTEGGKEKSGRAARACAFAKASAHRPT